MLNIANNPRLHMDKRLIYNKIRRSARAPYFY